MYECVQVGENTFFMDCPSRVGIYRDGGAAWLIDSGSDKDAAKKVLKILDDLGLRLEAAIVTHYHADHTGGAALLQQRTGCHLYLAEPLAPGDFPEINTAMLFGAHPPKPLRTKFFPGAKRPLRACGGRAVARRHAPCASRRPRFCHAWRLYARCSMVSWRCRG